MNKSSSRSGATNGGASSGQVAVVGGGIVGLAAAIACAQQDMSVLLFAPDDSAARQPVEKFEKRVYALSPASRAFLQTLRIWDSLDPAALGVIHDMRVFSGANLHSEVHLSAYQAGVEALAWVVGHQRLSEVLTAAIKFQHKITVVPEKVTAIEIEDAAVKMHCGSAVYSTELVVGADGIDSVVRKAAVIETQPKSLKAVGLVANFIAEKGHRNTAFQWFTSDGVIALLPLSAEAVSLVWSAPTELAEQLVAESSDEIAERLERYAASWYGKLTPLGAVSGFALNRLSLRKTVSQRLVLIGDAAHVVHPLAGQGLNLGLDDAAVLAQILGDKESFRSFGDFSLLRRYERKRKEAVQSMGWVTDGLNWLFGGQVPMLSAFATPAMALINRVTPIKAGLIKQALSNAVPRFSEKDA